MSLRKVILIVLLAAFNFSCASKKLESDPTESRDIYGEDVWAKDPKNADKIHTTLITDEVAPTGSNFYINSDRDQLIEKTLTPEQIQKITANTRAYFIEKGFKEVKTPKDAHIMIFVGIHRIQVHPDFDPVANEIMNQIVPDGIILSGYKTQVTTHSKIIRDGVVVENSTVVKDVPYIDRIYVTGNMHTYGVRPKQFFALTVDFDERTKSKLSILESTLNEYLRKLTIVPPAQAVSKQAPGCFPRFGFYTKAAVEDGVIVFKVADLTKNSPAQKAGLQIDDRILAIDSDTYIEALGNKEIYETKVPVPFKVGRGSETLRKNIKPLILCGGY